MTIISKQVASVKDIIDPERTLSYQDLTIPSYQRPYRWHRATVLTLYQDLWNAYQKSQGRPFTEYRMGTLILCQPLASAAAEIVDGQQRLTTLTLLLHALDPEKVWRLLATDYPIGSAPAIATNFALLQQKVRAIPTDEDRRGFQQFILGSCTVVQIVTDSLEEAFQFFDSQNSRGKALAPHDLLKAYHLREMTAESTVMKRAVVAEWEALDQDQLGTLFKDYLYPIIRWAKRQNGLGYDANRIALFKGIRADNPYNYATYHRASHRFIQGVNTYPDSQGALNEFQLTAPVIAGRSFFDFVTHYQKMVTTVERRLQATYREALPATGTGNLYVRRLFVCAVVLAEDRFGRLNSVEEQQLYRWAYSLRLAMYAVRERTLNKYALGERDDLNGFPAFNQLAEMVSPEDIDRWVLTPVTLARDASHYGPVLAQFGEEAIRHEHRD